MTARDDRSSALLVALPFARLFPEPDGVALSNLDRQQLGLLYRPIPATASIPATPAEVVNSSIENWYVIDYEQRRHRPITQAEWRWLKQVFQIWTRSQRKAEAAARLHAQLERRFSKGLRPTRKPRDLYARETDRNPRRLRANVRVEPRR